MLGDVTPNVTERNVKLPLDPAGHGRWRVRGWTLVQWFHDGISEAQREGGRGLDGGRARRSETIGYNRGTIGSNECWCGGVAGQGLVRSHADLVFTRAVIVHAFPSTGAPYCTGIFF